MGYDMSVAALKADLAALPPETTCHQGGAHCMYDMYLERQGVAEPRVYSTTYTWLGWDDEGDGEYCKADLPEDAVAAIKVVDKAYQAASTFGDGDFTAAQILAVLATLPSEVSP